MKVWLKGGLIGIISIIIIFIIGEVFGYFIYGKWVIAPIINFLFIPAVAILFYPLYSSNSDLVIISSILGISIIIYFIVGAIIGLIVSKIKSKKSRRNK